MQVKQIDDKLAKRSVKTQPKVEDALNNSVTLFFAQSNSLIEPYGRNILLRDKQLRNFILQEPYLLSAIYSMVAARSALSWELTGPPKSVKATQEMLLNSDYGNGWNSLIGKFTFDLAVCDNGGFLEIVRDKPRPGRNPWTAPVIGLNHLDSNKCIRTGNYKTPVIYMDTDSSNKVIYRKLKWWDVITFEEFPNPNDELKGIQISFVSRVLKAAEMLSSIGKYNEEKITGRFTKGIHLVSGVAQHEIDAIKTTGQLEADDAGLTRYTQALILASLDPNAKVAHEYVELASLPDNFDEDTVIKNYITLLATAGGMDFMDLAPLSGGNLGTASQSDTLDKKSKLKGLQLFIKLIEHKLTIHKVLPPNVELSFGQKDPSFEQEDAKTRKLRAEERKIRIESGEISIDVAQQIAVDDGDLKQEYLVMLGDTDITPSITVEDDDNVNIDVTTQNVEQTIETTLIEQRAKVHISLAQAVADWFRKLIDEHPIQNVSPIPASQLEVFGTALRNLVKNVMVIKTTDYWHDYILTLAAKEAGIQPHVLRMRLPDNYKLFVTKSKVFDNNKQIIKTYEPKPKQITTKSIQNTKKEYCDYCTKDCTKRTFIVQKGWVNTCDLHAINLGGFVGKSGSEQYNFEETKTAFRTQYLAIAEKYGYNSKHMLGLLASVFAYTYLLKNNDNKLDKKGLDVIRKEIQASKQLMLLNSPTIFINKLNKIYYS